MSENPILLECRDVCVGIRGKSLLTNVNLALRQGEHKVIIGPNGAGKTTLLRAILGSLTIRGGSILLGGRELSSLRQAEIAKLISYVPQLLAAEIPYNVREFVAMGRYAYGGGPRDAAVESALTAVGVACFADRVVSTLSGGERQRVCIAAALAQQAPILILDEPLVHLDPSQRMEVQRVLRELPREVTVMVVTHDLDWAKMNFQSLLSLRDGVVDYDGATVDFYSGSGVSRLFGEAVGLKYKEESI
jgi:ABC-type cobalamin/Fe3+-siderophores transport system ATPase subunit